MSDYRTHLRHTLIAAEVPIALQSGLLEYFVARRPTGSFLRAVLENDLREACVRADDINRYELHTIVSWLNRYCPSTGWGAPSIVEAWLASSEPVPEIFEG